MDKKKIGLAEVLGGAGLLLLGKKKLGLTLFAKGIYDLEKVYRDSHDDLASGFAARWERSVEYYEETHQNETNRTLHRVGIPVILAGTAGLIASKPYSNIWKASAGAFATGWALNIAGHSLYEKNAPAFAEDPLSFVMGPAWDLKQYIETKKGSEEFNERLE